MKKRIIEQQRTFMNTVISIKVFSGLDRKEIEDKLEEAFSKFDYVVKKFTRFDESSELSLLNNSKREFKASSELFYLVEFALRLAHETDGAYDPTIIDLLETYGYKKGYDFSGLDDREFIQNEIRQLIKTRPRFEDIKLDKDKLAIELMPNQRIDLGGIGKGYAIDLATETLKPLGNFIINAGGDIYASGLNKEGKPWKAGLLLLDERGKHEIIGNIELKNQALASSGSWARKVKYFHHLLNPKTGEPISDVMQTFVIAKDAITADAYATVLFTLGKQGLRLLEEKKLDGLIVDKTKHRISTDKFKV